MSGHWFDEFAKAFAENRLSRGAALRGAAQVALGAALGAVVPPGTSNSVKAHGPMENPLQTPAPGKLRRTPGISSRGKMFQPATVQRGACSISSGPQTVSTFASEASMLRLTIRREYSNGATRKGHHLSLTGQTVVELTDKGATVFHLESSFAHWNPHAVKHPDTTMNFRYGSSVQGASTSVITFAKGKMSGTIGAHTIASLTTHGSAPASNKLSDGHEFALVAETSLRQRMPELIAEMKRSSATCGAPAHPRRQRTGERVHQGVLLANANGDLPGNPTIPTGQNSGPLGGQTKTPACYNSSLDADTALSGCLVAAFSGGFLCPPCVAYAVWLCDSSWGAALADFEAPGGACNEVTCTYEDWDPGPKSCDTGYTCCGKYECCPTGYVCSPLGMCCPPEASRQCGTTYDTAYCCPADSLCGPHGDCLSCPAGQIAWDGICCDKQHAHADQNGKQFCCSVAGWCGDRCCSPFGPATPKPTKGPNICLRPSVPCYSTLDGVRHSACCEPNQTCCGDQCCSKGLTCCKNGLGKWGCNQCIK